MLRLASSAWLSGLLCLAACAGKAERGTSSNGDAAPVQKPAAGPANAESPRAEPARHLLMVVELEPDAHVARTLTSRTVEMALPKRRGPARQAPWRVDVVSAKGEVLYTAPLEDAATVRAEFRDEKTGELKGETAQKRVAAVTLRLPWLAGAREVRLVNVGSGAEVELARVAYPQVNP